ncbi:MAG: AAA family ATPase [bacterium]|nr:AAA family ATPase [bacterium]
MLKEFNDTGTCIPEMHYLVNTSKKLDEILTLIMKRRYFTINRPRQYGKSTTLFLLSKLLTERKDYVPIEISFEGIGSKVFENESSFIKVFLTKIMDEVKYLGIEKNVQKLVSKNIETNHNMAQLSGFITEFTEILNQNIVLMIDEVDKSSNNQLFLDFLAMLRDKYLNRNKGKDSTFQSIILAGVHDVKNLKLKLRPDDEKKLNSPWNIAVDFEVDMSFNPEEIATMLEDYSQTTNISMNIPQISELLYYHTSGYPFLVSRLCKLIDEKIMKKTEKPEWKTEYIDEAVKLILQEKNTNFDSLIKNLENYKELYDLVFETIIEGIEPSYNADNPVIDMAATYGILKNENGKVKIHNRIYEQRIYNYMSSKVETAMSLEGYNFRDNFINEDGTLDFEKVLLKFREFMKKEYSSKDKDFLERNGRLLFLAFIKPIINGYGYDFKEVQISEELRLDVVITYLNQKYVVELKIWRGDVAHQKGLAQLSQYLDKLELNKGFLIIFDSTKFKNKDWKTEKVVVENKEIFIIMV